MIKKINKAFLLILILQLSCTSKHLYKAESFTYLQVKDSPTNDSAIKAITPYKLKIDSLTEQVIVQSLDVFTKEKEQHALGNFVCDAMKWAAEKEMQTQCNVVLINRGGLRSTLPKGDIKVLNIFELMPFDNELVMITLSGKKLMEGIKMIVEKKHSYWGLQIKTNQVNEILDEKMNGETIHENKNYLVLTSDYIANGGDKFDFLVSPIHKKLLGIKIRDAIINYCIQQNKEGKSIIPYTDERLQISK